MPSPGAGSPNRVDLCLDLGHGGVATVVEAGAEAGAKSFEVAAEVEHVAVGGSGRQHQRAIRHRHSVALAADQPPALRAGIGAVTDHRDRDEVRKDLVAERAGVEPLRFDARPGPCFDLAAEHRTVEEEPQAQP
jgi:hypothetical protein